MDLPGWLQLRGVQALLRHRSRPALVARALRGRPFRRSAPIAGERLRIAAVQRHIHLVESAEQYAAEAYTVVAAAVAYGAQAICLPEHNGLHLLGLLPGAAESLPGATLHDLLVSASDGEPDLADIFRLVGPAASRVFEATWSTLARGFGIPIVAGSLVLPDGQGVLRNTLFAFGSDGRRIGVQHKLNPSALERGWVAPGDKLAILRLPNTRLAAPICTDHAYWETARLAVRDDAEVLVGPSSIAQPYSWWAQSRTVWSRVQEVGVFGVQPTLVGDFLGLSFRGRSGIYAPLELSPHADGILAAARDDHSETVVAADLDLAALRRHRAGLPAPRPELVGRYLPRLYREGVERPDQDTVFVEEREA